MSLCAPAPDIVALDRVEIAVEPFSWAFATERRAEIERHFAGLQRERASVWNGRVVLLSRFAIANGAMRGACFETDYASFSAWRDWGFPDPGVYNVFAAAALRSADGAYIIGEMAPDTAGAGLLYFPCGTPEPDDIDADGALDLAGNLRREFFEETGLDVDTFEAESGWHVVRDCGYVAVLKRMVSHERADALRARILKHIAGEPYRELSDIRIVRGPSDLDPAMPRFVVAFLEQEWRR